MIQESHSVEHTIAVVGLACRLPGASGPAALWDLLRGGRTSVGRTPAERWVSPDGDPTGWGAFLDDVRGFDAGFFGISPREARTMDPQQRLLLELSWEALEDAGIPADSLRETPAAVFIGAMNDDYALLARRSTAATHTLTGTSRGVLANRVSHRLRLRGASLTVDTGQSSALVAVHLAAESLRRGETDLALAGGVQLNLAADAAQAVASFGALSPDGRCWTFDERANGFVRGEGGGVVILKRLSGALADGDTVYGVIEGGAVNNDGAVGPLAQPSAAAQRDVIAAAYRRAGISPRQVQYVELHGTGTRVGDPAEAEALGALHSGRGDTPLLIGSVKTNVGHLEGAAGIAGLLKTLLALRHRAIPATLNCERPNPAIRFDEWRLRVVDALTPWPATDGPARAGVSSFGMGGTNCHLILAEGPAADSKMPGGSQDGAAPEAGSARTTAWLLSARTAAALRDQAHSLASYLELHPEVTAADVAHSLVATRSRLPRRVVLLGADRATLLAGLRSVAADDPAPVGHTVPASADDRAGVTPRRPVFVFPGQGTQWQGMGADLLDGFPAFAGAVADCEQALAPYVDWSLAHVLRTGAGLDRVEVVQPALWGMMVSLAALWRAHGVTPAAVVGHSQGEVAAACVAGVLSLADGARIVAHRSRLLAESLTAAGGMLAVAAPADVVTQRLSPWAHLLSIGAVNGPSAVVVVGDLTALDEFAASWPEGTRLRRIDVQYAAHSPEVERLRDGLAAALGGITPRAADIPFYSTVEPGELPGATLDADYWYRNLRARVGFHPAMVALLTAGHGDFLEVSPHPVLTSGILDTAAETATASSAVVLSTLRRDEGGQARFLRALADWEVAGGRVDWSAVVAGGRRVALPTYPFQREPYWLDDSTPAEPRLAVAESQPGEQREAEEPAAAGVPDLARLLRSACAAVLGHRDVAALDLSLPYRDLGFDSALTAELAARLAQLTGLRITTSDLFDHATPAGLAAHLAAPGAGRAADIRPAGPVDTDDPIVIVGIGCRMPGDVTSAEQLWDLVLAERDAIGAMPVDRGWPSEILAREQAGGFLADVADFDAEFFGISPREALAMDPQQRLLLETAWEALERAGLDPAALHGTRTGVFVGAMAQEYGPRLHEGADDTAGYLLTGTTPSVLSGRLAYSFGFEGPAVTVDTACSSSLVAMHLAAQALRSGECDLALTGGVTVMSEPGIFVEFHRQGGLAPDGRCKAFGDAADGTGWAEGVGLLVLEKLSSARRNRHRVLAVVRGSAINQDGASNGLTAPNGLAQRRVIDQALANAGLHPVDVDVVEAHGTGTRLGDPIEAQALLATYGQEREIPLLLGSIKSNIGHTQAAAGVAGVIKMVMAMRHGTVPRSLYADPPSSRVDWSAGAVRLVCAATEWPSTNRPRRAAVSSFGISGTNAHVILEAPPEDVFVRAGSVLPVPWPVSARTVTGLRQRLDDLSWHAVGHHPADIGSSLAARTAFAARAVLLAGEDDGGGPKEVARGIAQPTDTGPIFVFGGQGSQWVGMATGLLDSSPVFAARLAECERALGLPIRELLSDEQALSRVDVVQPALWAVMVSVAAVWQDLGVEPSAVIGHSQGEAAAAVVAGALSLADGARVVLSRSRLIASRLSGRGGMASVALPEAAVRERLVAQPQVSIAAVNGPRAVVLAAAPEALERLVGQWTEAGERARLIGVDYASHSAEVEVIKAELIEALNTISPYAGRVPFFSTVDAAWSDTAGLDAGYWFRNLRQTVRFEESVRALLNEGHRTFLEMSPHPVLTAAIAETAGDVPVATVGSLHRDQADYPRLLAALAEAWVAGVDVDWRRLFPGHRPADVELPTYPFERERFWPRPRSRVGDVAALGLTATAHPLLGALLEDPRDGGLFGSGRLSLATHPWLADHTVGGVPVLPATAYIEIAVHLGDQTGCPAIADLTLERPLAVPTESALLIRASVGAPAEAGHRSLELHARIEGMDTPWTRYATGVLAPAESAAAPAAPSWPPARATAIDLDGFYSDLAENGFDYGPAFAGLRALWRDPDGTVFAEAVLPGDQAEAAAKFGLHPALLDAALHASWFAELDETPHGRLPYALSGVTLHSAGADALRVTLRRVAADTVTLTATDPSGRPVASIDRITLRPRPTTAATDPLYQVQWRSLPASKGDREAVLLPVGSGPNVTAVTYRVLEAVRAHLAVDSDLPLLVVTSGAVALDGPADPTAAAVWGLVSSAQAENPDRIVLVDADEPLTREQVGAALATGEPRLVRRRGVSYAGRMVPLPPTLEIPPGAPAWRLEAATGALDGLRLLPAPQPSLGDGEVRVAVRAAGLNFRDVLIALGMYPEHGVVPGVEVSGVITETGTQVAGLAVGDRVVGLLPGGGFGSDAVVDARLLAPVPAGWSFAAAAAVPVAFATAYHALVEVAAVRPGETVLIHAAAGGVGMAAVQIARRLGAEVYATASETKWDTLRALGIPDDRIASSRTLDFAQRFTTVDVVLNSLSGEFVDASVGLLGAGGRFVELGKTDLRDPATWPGLAYHSFDLLRLDLDQSAALLRTALDLVSAGELTALPTRAYDVRQAKTAFQHVAQARHTGKIVLTVPRPLDPDATVLITGGTGGLGALVARHLVAQHGARRLLLAGRRGPDTPGATKLATELTAAGAEVEIAACDVADREAVRRLVSGRALTAVIHAAGVLDDATIDSLTADQLAGVLAPKAGGAANLHELTQDHDLAAFVLFSSVAGVLGTAGQSAYAAANAYLDAFAHQRHDAGLPALSLAWGPWTPETGMTAALQQGDLNRLASAGFPAIPAARGLALLDAALRCGQATVVAALVDRAALRALPQVPPLLAEVISAPVRQPVRSGAEDASWTATMRRLPVGDRLAAITDLVNLRAAAVLGHATGHRVDPTRSFRELGFDSLTAIELRNRLATATGLRLPATLIFDHPTVAAVARHLLDRILPSLPASAGPAPVAASTTDDDAVVIVGMACRYPGGADSADRLWELLRDGRDAITAFPTDRDWPAATTYAALGGFLDDVAGFDASFFGISPREALAMDPQQRLLLETTWEALEHANIDPGSLRGRPVGVFVGAIAQDYEDRVDDGDGYLLTGNAASVASGRVAYELGLEGPAITVDTACSSSLVALHLAVQAVRAGECELAVAGGVTVMSSPRLFVEFTRQGGLSSDGRCKAFSDGADGTGFAEGVGLVVVERLSDARRSGHPVLAVVRGSAVNQDGASNGLTAPNGPSQQRVIRQALANARLSSSDVDVVEAHGTGTKLGDPIEAQALLATYGQDRVEPLLLGSIKSNIGHTQAAAGVAGVIKMVQAMRHGLVPGTLHVDKPSAQVDWTFGAVALAVETTAWPQTGRPRRAGVSSFGISGTNAHVIVEAASELGSVGLAGPLPLPLPWVLSAGSAAALRAREVQVGALLGADLEQVGAALARRGDLSHRAVLFAGPDFVEVASGVVEPGGGIGAVFVFGGQGSQWVGMAVDLVGASPVFAARLAQCERALGLPVRELLSDERALSRVDVVQPVLWAVMVSVAAFWQGMGVEPVAVVGHSQGEVAAAVVAGVLSLEDGARVVLTRSRLIAGRLSGRGMMASVALPEGVVRDRLAGVSGVSVAAVNGPRALVLSGASQVLRDLVSEWSGAGERARLIDVDYASHSVGVEEIEADLVDALRGLTAEAGLVPFFSTVDAGWCDGAGLDAGYWYRNLRQTVRFAESVRVLLHQGHRVFVEMSPHPVLTAAIAETAGDVPVIAVGSLRRNEVNYRRLLTSLAQVYVAGVDVDWARLFTGVPAAPLPPYPFDRKRYWPRPRGWSGDLAALGLAPAAHPLLGAAVDLPQAGAVAFTGRLSLATHPWLRDHAVGGAVLFPGTGYAELAFRAGDQAGCPHLDELTLEIPLVIAESGGVQVQIWLGPAEADARRPVHLYARPAGSDGAWRRHATGTLAPAAPVAAVPETTVPPAGAVALDLDGFYAGLADTGFAYGPAFAGLRAAWRGPDGEVYADVELPPDEATEAGAYGLHPALLDAALHAAWYVGLPDAPHGRLPFAWRGVALHATGARALRVRLRRTGDDTITLAAVDPTGAPVLTAEALALRPVPAGIAGPAVALLHRVEWTPVAPSETVGDAGTVLVVADPALAGRLDAGHIAALADATAGLAGCPAVLLPVAPTDAHDLPAAVHTATSEILAAIQEWLVVEPSTDVPLVVLTRGATAAAGHDPDLATAAVTALVRSAQAENPGRFLLLDADPHGVLTADLLSAFLATGEPQAAVRAGDLLVPRIVRDTPADQPAPGASGNPDGTVLVTGGLTGLGALVARHLVTRLGVRNLLLLSRRGTGSDGATELVAELTAHGTTVTVAACDAGDRDALAAVLDAIPAGHPLTAVIHSAGVLDDGLVTSMDPARLAAVLRPKADAAWHLHELTRHLALDRFVVFSSVAGLLGSAGQSNYAAANGFLDALTIHRHRLGLPGVSIAWGPWLQGSGMTTAMADGGIDRMTRQGLPALEADAGLALFDAALATTAPVVVATRIDRAAVRSHGWVPPLLRALVPQPSRRRAADGTGADDLARRLAGLAPAERDAELLNLVRAHAATVLGHAYASSVGDRRSFADLGFDSLTAVELRNRLRHETGLRLPATLVFDYPNPQALVAYLAQELTGGGPALSATEAAPTAVAADPIVIVGMACRFPGGVSSTDELWRLVADSADAISAFPDDRGWEALWPHQEPPVRQVGGFLDGVADFDPAFFGMSPREALGTDPQHRLLLETAWEAFEHAGIDPDSLHGSRTGVFAGVMYHDYASYGEFPEAALDYLGNGTAGSVASGRVAYTFGLEGPAVTVDTACSSSLVAIHLAAQSLRSGESTLALAGGVTVLATPDVFLQFARQGGLAGDGRCKAFADSADGTAFAEGVGLVVVERLSDARRNGHQVLAVVRGSAVNQDGASNGLTAPNGPSQQRVIRQALASAGLQPGDVDVVEAHGTGTKLGDPIEAQALLATYGQDRVEPLLLGSIKSNIGHTQAAAGVAGVIKMVEAMRQGTVPATLHVDAPSSQVEWESGAVRLVTEATGWPQTGRPRRAGVSSFGISGTNAHVIVEAAAELGSVGLVGVLPRPLPWVLSARSAAALRAREVQVGGLLGGDLEQVGAALARRGGLSHRAVLFAGPDLVEVASGVVEPGGVGPVFVFGGQGSQWVGMAVDLVDASPVFAARLAQCERALGMPVRELLSDERALSRVDVVQPVLWAVMVSVAAFWQDLGVEPVAVVGHSQGEVAAAVVAGVLSLEDGARVVLTRSRLIAQRLSGRGMMASVALPEEVVRERLVGVSGVSVAAVNAPRSLVLAGASEVVRGLVSEWSGAGERARLIDVDYASHSVDVEEIEADLVDALRGLTAEAGRVPFFSTVDAGWCDGAGLDAGYWYRNLRQTVRFAESVRVLLHQGHRVFVEMSPHPVLTAAIAETAGDTPVIAVGSLRRNEVNYRRLLTSLAQAYVAGVDVEWARLFTGVPAAPLPPYPFDRKRYWPAPGGRNAIEPDRHPILDAPVELPQTGGLLFTGRLGLGRQPWLADHAVGETVLFPGTGFLELAARAARHLAGGQIEELVVERPLLLPERGEMAVQVWLGAVEQDGRRVVQIHARPTADESWQRYATGSVVPAPDAAAPEHETAWPPVTARPVSVDGFYGDLAGEGFRYGPAFRGLRTVWRDQADRTVWSEVVLPEEQAGDYGLHPALLDAALQGIWFVGLDVTGRPRLPFAWSGVQVHQTGVRELRVRLRPAGPDSVTLAAFDGMGRPVLTVRSLTLREVSAAALRPVPVLYTLSWQPVADGERHEGARAEMFAVPTGRGDVPAAVRAATTLAGEQLNAWLSGEARSDATLVVVTAGAAVGDAAAELASAAVAGLVRSAQAEHPGRIVLLEADDTESVATLLPAVVAAGEPHLRLRDGRLSRPRLTGAASQGQAAVLPSEGTVLVTGGTSGIGALTARHLVTAHGVRRLLLVSRRGPDAPGAAALAEELTAHGAQVTVAACDVGDRAALSALLDTIPADRPLIGVVHAAGVLDDGLLAALDPARFDAVLRPKADAAWHLHELTRDRPLAFFALFSSYAGLSGSAGQANYAAANAVLDALATRRRAEGLPGVSVVWGPWAQGTGMSTAMADGGTERLRRTGYVPLAVDDGLALLDAALAGTDPVPVAVRLDRVALRAQGWLPPLLRELVSAPAGATAVAQLSGLTGERLRAAVRETVLGQIAVVLGHPSPSAVDPGAPLPRLGFDSLTALELRNRLALATGLRLPVSAVLDRGSAATLADRISTELSGTVTGLPQQGDPGRPADAVAELFVQAVAAGKLAEAEELLLSVARLRPTYTGAQDAAPIVSAALSGHPGGARFIGIAPIVPLTGTVAFATLAAALGEGHAFTALAPLGFAGEEPLAATADAFVATHADAVTAAAGSDPYVLIGLSSGGVVAYEIARRLTAAGHGPRAVVLLDTFAIEPEGLTDFQRVIAGWIAEGGDRAAAVDRVTLSAFAWTCRLFLGWRPAPEPFPTLLVRAAEPLRPDDPGRAWRTSLPHVTAVVDVPGNHLTIAERHADGTARAITDWLADLD